MRLFLIWVCLFFLHKVTAQLPQGVKLPDWKQAGTIVPDRYYNQLEFNGDATGKIDNTPLLQQLLDTLKKPTVVVLGNGNFLFKSKIILPSGCVLRGRGAQHTILQFSQNSVHAPSIEIRGTENSTFYPLITNALQDSAMIQIDIKNALKVKKGQILRLYQNDSSLINDSWALKSTGQLVEVADVLDDKIVILQKLRQDFLLSKSAGFKIVTPAIYSGIEHLKIIRYDYTNTGSGSSNILLRYAWKTIIKSVESENCNFAHLEANYSGKLLVEDSYFHDAFNFGGNGRAYGIMLQYSTGDALIQNNIFKTLRHAMILQAGANGNVFAFNYATQSKKEIFAGFYGPGEDIALHGNYPFGNLFEGNEVNIASVDNSHGKNGPTNTFFKNRITNGYLLVTNPLSNGQVFVGNHLINATNSFAANAHWITDNSWQGLSSLTTVSMFFEEKPEYVTTLSPLPGAPAFATNPAIPAISRLLANKPIGKAANELIWNGKTWNSCLQPGSTTSFCNGYIYSGNRVLLNNDVKLTRLELKNGAAAEMPINGKLVLTGQ